MESMATRYLKKWLQLPQIKALLMFLNFSEAKLNLCKCFSISGTRHTFAPRGYNAQGTTK